MYLLFSYSSLRPFWPFIGPDIGVDKITAQQYRPRRCRFSQREQIDRDGEHSWHNRPFNPPIDPILENRRYIRMYDIIPSCDSGPVAAPRRAERELSAAIGSRVSDTRTCSNTLEKLGSVDARENETRRRQGDGSDRRGSPSRPFSLPPSPPLPPGRLPVSSRRPAGETWRLHTTSNRFIR